MMAGLRFNSSRHFCSPSDLEQPSEGRPQPPPYFFIMTNRTTCLLLGLTMSFTLGTAVASPSDDVDALLAKDWQALKLAPNAPASNEVFVRRVYLDVVGRIPTYREAETFLNSKDSHKRAALIDSLLAGEGYVQHFFNFWADILRAQSRGEAAGGTTGSAYVNFIKDSLRSNKPYDQFVRELVSAQGRPWDNGAVGYYKRDRGMPLENTANTVRVFLGTRIECAQCHNHPFDKWTQMQFYHMAAFTYGVETGYFQAGKLTAARALIYADEAKLREAMAASKTSGDAALKAEQEQLRDHYRHMHEALNMTGNPLAATMIGFQAKNLLLPHDYKYPDAAPKSVVKPAAIMGAPAETATLEGYAAWMTSPENPRFTKVIANRLWKKVFGLGLIEPVDEILDATVPANPALMAHLEAYMRGIHYDMKTYLRTLLNTQAYQRSVCREEFPPGITCHFTGPVLRRMTAEQMWDSFVTLITPSPDLPDLPLHEDGEKRLLGARKMNDAIEALTPQEAYEGARAAADTYRRQAAEMKALQKLMTEARAKDDTEAIKVLGRKTKELQTSALRAVNDSILVPAVHKLAARHSPAAPVQNVMMLGGDVEINMGRVDVPGYGLRESTRQMLGAQREAETVLLQDEMKYFGVPEKQAPAYLQQRLGQIKTWHRAADIESPAPRGHYLRELGQSDRETIENGNADASIPQALDLMNGELLPPVLAPYSQVMLAVHKAAGPERQMEAVYLALLSRMPTAREKAAWLKAQFEGLGGIEDLVYALINTQQFLFIQ